MWDIPGMLAMGQDYLFGAFALRVTMGRRFLSCFKLTRAIGVRGFLGTLENQKIQCMSVISCCCFTHTTQNIWHTLRSRRIQGLSAALVRGHLAGSRNKHFYSLLDGRRLFTWNDPEFWPNAGYVYAKTCHFVGTHVA